MSHQRSIWLWGLAGLLFLAGLAWAGSRVYIEHARLSAPFDPADARFVGSDTCKECHEDRHRSWSETYHRTMTQEAGPHSVQGEFDGRALDYWGVRVRPIRENGHYYFEYSNPETGEILDRYRIERTVGSNRYQQYLTRLPDDETYVRLHYLWHNGDQRWVHMNAAFLSPDDQPFDNHVAIWNQNCIFCHNTGPQPRMTNYDELRDRAAAGQPVSVATDSRFESRVAELGISCETCHGPGSIHATRAGQFWARTTMQLMRGADESIVLPVRLEHERATEVCGQCHGQRIPKTPELLRTWVHDGPTFRAGLDLQEHINPVFRHTKAPVEGQEDIFVQRFWADGTPRLTAYEYQGLLLSSSHQEAQLTCTDCHSMHAGDPHGQITERNRGNAPCLRCHQEYRRNDELVAHTRHDADSGGSLCYNCHMPEVVYGVMDIHRSHRIEIPDVVRDAATGRPNACLNCHLDRSPEWAASELAETPWHGSDDAVFRADGVDTHLSEAAAVIAGDPVQKAVLAWRGGRPDGALHGIERAWLVPYLLEAMGDIYASSRRFAQNSLAAILDDWPRPAEVASLAAMLPEFDFMADAPQRETARARLLVEWQRIDKTAWPAPPPASGLNGSYDLPDELRDRLVELGRRQDKQISIGE